MRRNFTNDAFANNIHCRCSFYKKIKLKFNESLFATFVGLAAGGILSALQNEKYINNITNVYVKFFIIIRYHRKFSKGKFRENNLVHIIYSNSAVYFTVATLIDYVLATLLRFH
jgi:hypothetical protein